MKYSIHKSDRCEIAITIESLDLLKRIPVWRSEPLRLNKGLVSRINADIPSFGGIYFLFGDAGILLYIGKAANIRQRINIHTKQRTLEEIASQSKPNPAHIKTMAWIMADDAGCRDILETAYLRSYGTAWNIDKIDAGLEYPEPPLDEDLEAPKVKEYIARRQALLNESFKAVADRIFGEKPNKGVQGTAH